MMLLLREPTRKNTLIFSVLLGFALLSKYTATFLLPFSLLSLLLASLLLWKENEEQAAPYIRKASLSMLSAFLLAGIIIGIFVPAVFLRKSSFWDLLTGFSDSAPIIIGGTLVTLLLLTTDAVMFRSKALLASFSFLKKIPRTAFLSKTILLVPPTIFLIVITLQAFSFEAFVKVPFDVKNVGGIQGILGRIDPLEVAVLEFNPLVFSLSLPVLFGILSLLVFSRKKETREPFFRESILLSLFLIIFPLAQAFSGVIATIRYGIILYPAAAFLAALGYFRLVPILLEKKKSVGKPVILTTFTILLPLVLIIEVWISKPFYFNYTNPLLPDGRTVVDGWGYGGYEAAQYINSLPHERPPVVWSDYGGVCPFIKGICITNYRFDTEKYVPDYYVFTRRGEIRFNPGERSDEPGLVDAKSHYSKKPDWLLEIGGRPENFVKVVKADNELRASIITDIDHCVTRGAAPEAALDRFIAFTDERDVDITISLGDNLSHRLGDCSKHYREDLPFVVSKLNRTKSPNHWVLGDHDIASSDESYRFWLEQTGQKETFYSFDEKNTHIVILNTITGGEPLVRTCEDSGYCKESLTEKTRLDTLARDPRALSAHLKESGKTRAEFVTDRVTATKKYQDELAIVKMSRDANDRDRGMVLQRELDWLADDIAKTEKDRILVFSDHPLFPFTSYRKSYDILNGDKVREILEGSGKEVVAISGEAHLWYEEERNGIRYFIVDQFKNLEGTWGLFSWNKNSAPHMERIVGQ